MGAFFLILGKTKVEGVYLESLGKIYVLKIAKKTLWSKKKEKNYVYEWMCAKCWIGTRLPFLCVSLPIKGHFFCALVVVSVNWRSRQQARRNVLNKKLWPVSRNYLCDNVPVGILTKKKKKNFCHGKVCTQKDFHLEIDICDFLLDKYLQIIAKLVFRFLSSKTICSKKKKKEKERKRKRLNKSLEVSCTGKQLGTGKGGLSFVFVPRVFWGFLT